MTDMRATSDRDLQENLAATLDRVAQDHEPVLITRGQGKPAAVLVSAEDFASIEETAYLLQSPRNRDRLLEAVRELNQGGGYERTLSE